MGTLTEKKQKKAISQDAFYKWRSVIALAHLDKKIQPVEKAFIIQKLREVEKHGITQEQLDILREDFKTPQKPIEFLGLINNPYEMIHALILGFRLLWCDEEFHFNEKRSFNYLLKKVASLQKINRFFLEDICKDRSIKTVEDVKKAIKSYNPMDYHVNSFLS